MLIGIITDSHENMDNIKKAVTLFNEKKVELVLHCGDIISPITARHFKELKSKMKLVFGNNDGEKVFLINTFKEFGTFHEPGYEFEQDGKKFIMMHEPIGIDALAESGKYNYILYGHTHKQDIRKIGKSTIINVGESCTWLNGQAFIGILDTVEDKVEIISL